MNTYASNRLEQLAEQLAVQQPASVFQKTYYVTQTAGMNAWLKKELTYRNGILANSEFLNQETLIGHIHSFLFNAYFPTNTDQVRYRLYNLLNSPEFTRQFGEISSYYEDDSKKRFDLAGKIADLFDQYQIYRSDTLSAWEKDSPVKQAYGNWQKWLWNNLQIESKTAIRQRMIAEIKSRKVEIQAEFPMINIVGMSIITPFYMEFFQELSTITTVNMFFCSPVKQLYSEFKNPLLESLGSNLNNWKPYCDFSLEDDQSSVDSDLQLLQYQIRTDSAETNRDFTNDGTIQFNSCFSEAREVEVLYNYLLDAFDKDRSLKSGDILVMTTDMDLYTPYITAFFKNAPVRIPIQISGKLKPSGDTIVACLEQLLTIDQLNFTAESVVSLLENKRVAANYQINDTFTIRSIVRNANIRFGIDNRASDESNFVGFRMGLRKIALGYAMLADNQMDTYDGIFPYRDLEARDSWEMFKVNQYVTDLENILNRKSEFHTLTEWKRIVLDEVLETMIFSDEYNKADRQEINEIYRSLSFIDLLTGMDNEAVPFSVFLSELKNRLFVQERDLAMANGSVLFSAPIPTRGLPYKVICFLGLNSGTFPRDEYFATFDLLNNHQDGDRSKKESDKYLFLETLMSARKQLYFSFVGKSSKTNTELPPSVVVDELIHFTGLQVLEHPLHGFSAAYQANNDRLFTYFYSQESETFPTSTASTSNQIQLSLRSFLKFFENPIDWYFNNILSINYDEKEESIPERELIELNALEKWKVKKQLLQNDGSAEQLISKMKQDGLLPLKTAGNGLGNRLNEEINGLKIAFNQLTAGKTKRNVPIDFTSGDLGIVGSVDTIFDRSYVDYYISTSTKKHRTRAYLTYLLLTSAGEIDEIILLNAKGIKVPMPVKSKGEATEILNHLAGFVIAGQKKPIKITLSSSEITEQEIDEKTKNKIIENFKKEAVGNPFSGKSPNIYMANLIEDNYLTQLSNEELSLHINLSSLLTL